MFTVEQMTLANEISIQSGIEFIMFCSSVRYMNDGDLIEYSYECGFQAMCE